MPFMFGEFGESVSGSDCTVLCGVIAPITSASPSSRTPRRSSIFPMSTIVSGAASRSSRRRTGGHRRSATPTTDAATRSFAGTLSTWTPARGLLHGALSTTLDLSGAGVERRDLTRTLTAIGVAAVANGTLGPAPALEEIAKLTGIPAFRTTRFRDAKLPFRIERGRVVTDPVVLDGPHGEWRLSGAIGFDGSLEYAVSTTVPAELAAGLGSRAALAAGALADPQGRILIDLRVSGTAKSPRVSWDPTSMRNRLAGRALEAIQQQRERLEQQLRDEAEARRKAVEDSARSAAAVYRKAIEDSLKRKARDVLKGFFGGPRDTAGK